MKLLISLSFLFSLSAFAESYNLRVGDGITICSEGFCLSQSGILQNIEIEINEDGTGEYWLARKIYDNRELDRYVAITKTDESCLLTLGIIWINNEKESSQKSSITCEEFERVKLEQVEHSNLINGTDYKALISINL